MNLTHSLFCLLAEEARRGVDSCPNITTIMDSVPVAMIDPSYGDLWDAMLRMSVSGTPPTIPAMKRRVKRSDDFWAKTRSAEASIPDVKAALIKEYQLSRYAILTGEISAMVAKGLDAQTINKHLMRAVDESVYGTLEATDLSTVDYLARRRDMESGKFPTILTPFRALNTNLGGGFFCHGDLCMTVVAAYTGVGKSRFAHQIAWSAAQQGHTVIIFCGESDKHSVKESLLCIVGNITKFRIRQPLTPTLEADLKRADSLLSLCRIKVFDDRFDVDVIRGLMSKHKSEMTSGRLLCIVDNIDHAVDTQTQQAWQKLEGGAKDLYSTARRLESHIILLSQSTKDAYENGRAPGLGDLARASLIGSHASNIIGLYRGDGAPQMLVNKTRSGMTGEVPVSINENMGVWGDV